MAHPTKTIRPTRDPELFWSKTKPGPNGCLEWTAARDKNGYGIYTESHGVQFKAHRYAYALAHGECPGELLACHACDNPACVAEAHLFLGTHATNAIDKVNKGRSRNPKGETHPNASLTAEQVIEMREMRAAGAKVAELAARFGVVTATATGICTGRHWAHVGGPRTAAKRRLTSDDVERIRSLYSTGLTRSAVATLIGVSYVTVRSVVNGISWKAGKAVRLTDTDRALMRELYASGVCKSEIARRMNVHKATVICELKGALGAIG